VDAAARILDAADELFGEIGFDGTSTREIAERAGVNKALIHYHYESKDALLESLLSQYYDRLNAEMVSALGYVGADFRSQFGHLIDCYFDFLVANRNFARIVQREATGGPHTELLWQRMEFMFRAGRRVIELQFPASAGTDFDAYEVLLSFHGMVIDIFNYSGVLEHMAGGDPLAPEMIDRRRRHLHAMLDITVAALERIQQGSQSEERP
jgi:AcrR family transcriptional regulator